MCKLMMICGIPSRKSAAAAKFIRNSVPFMTENDDHGLGYAALGSEGIFGERWLNVESAFKNRHRFSKSQQALNSFFENAVGHNYENYTRFGKGNLNKASTILFHTRYATNSKTMRNTHPFVIDDTALIHNGVILNDDDIMSLHENKISTCDSEAILQEYISNNVNHDPESIQEVADLLEGWYACGVLSKDFNDKYIVDIFKCERSNLMVGIVPELEAFVFCTELEILEKTAKASKMNVIAHDDIVGGKLIRIDPITGDKIKIVEFKPEPDKKMLKTIKNSKYSFKDDEYSNWDYVAERFPAA